MLQSGSILVSDEWLRALTKDDLAAGCQEAWLSALPSKALKDQWVTHASGSLYLHHLAIHGLEKICKHDKVKGSEGKQKAQLIKLLEAASCCPAAASCSPAAASSPQATPPAMQPDIATAMAHLRIDQAPLVSQQRLLVLTCEQLQELCRARVLPASGSKPGLVKQLQQDNITLNELSKSELKALCKAEQLAVSGSCATLIERLQQMPAKVVETPPKQQQVHEESKAQEAAVSKSGDLLQAGKKMVGMLACFCCWWQCDCLCICGVSTFLCMYYKGQCPLCLCVSWSAFLVCFCNMHVLVCRHGTSMQMY